jgi:hypothetical protein
MKASASMAENENINEKKEISMKVKMIEKLKIMAK